MRFIKITKLILGGGLASCVLWGCIDNNYDLSDIDTHVSVQVNDLVIPINLDAICLKSVIDLGDDDAVRVIDGQYAAIIDGAISSSPVTIQPFLIPKPDDESRSVIVPVNASGSLLSTENPLLSAPILSDDTRVWMKMSATDIDPAIQSLDKMGFESDVQIDIAFDGLSELVDGITIRDLKVQFPPNGKMTVSNGGFYDPTTGKIFFPESMDIEGTSIRILCHINEFGTEGVDMDLTHHAMDYKFDCSANGSLAVNQDQLKPGVDPSLLLALPTVQYHFGVSYLSDLEVNSFSGAVDYAYPDMAVSPVKLDDMPDVLSQPGTCVEIANPQIYFSLNNPLYGMDIHADMSLTLSPEPASPLHFETGISTYNEQNVFCLSPYKPTAYYKSETTDYSQAVYQPFDNLGKVLKGDGLPQQINIDVSASVKQQVYDFKLGEYGSVEGHYTFYAPLALSKGSEVFYTDTIAGWNDEEVDAMTVRRVRLTTDVVKDIPYVIDMTIRPIDVDGQVIEDCLATATLGAQTGEPIPLDVELEGEIRHLDGIVISAHVRSEKAETLSPQMALRVSKVRITATGSYDKEL